MLGLSLGLGLGGGGAAVGSPIISPSSVALNTGGAQTFTASGGSGAGYVYTLQSGAETGSLLVGGVLLAGLLSGTVVVRVTDSNGRYSEATVVVTGEAPDLWRRADLLVTPGATFTWGESSGHALADAIQATAGQQPTIGTAINGRPTLHFAAASNQVLTCTSLLSDAVGSTEGTTVVVGKYGGALALQAHGYTNPGAFGASDGALIHYACTNGVGIYASDGAERYLYDPVALSGAPYYATTHWTGGVWNVSTNGDADVPGAWGAIGLTGSLLFGRSYAGSSSNGFWEGDIGEIITWKTDIGATRRARVQAYLHHANNWGI